jgi:hypothetical protein
MRGQQPATTIRRRRRWRRGGCFSLQSKHYRYSTRIIVAVLAMLVFCLQMAVVYLTVPQFPGDNEIENDSTARLSSPWQVVQRSAQEAEKQKQKQQNLQRMRGRVNETLPLEDRMDSQKVRLQALQHRVDSVVEHQNEQKKESIQELAALATADEAFDPVLLVGRQSHASSKSKSKNISTSMTSLFQDALVDQEERLQRLGVVRAESMAHLLHGHTLSCNDLFGRHQLRSFDPSRYPNTTTTSTTTVTATSSSTRRQSSKSSSSSSSCCIEHVRLGWVACRITDPILLDHSKIRGSRGGEELETVLGRPESEELLEFDDGALTLFTTSNDANTSILPFPPNPHQLSLSYQRGMLELLATTNVVEGVPTTTDKKEFRNVPSIDLVVLVRRGAYANPCMQLLCMYNVYTLLEEFQLLQQQETPPISIVWLDGHARGKLDDVWPIVFGTQPRHIKELAAGPNTGHDTTKILWKNTVVVNTLSAIGDEGFRKYTWSSSNSNSTTTIDCDLEPRQNTLVSFRDHLLQQYGLERKTYHNSTFNNRLTLLIREDYQAHPRSDGRTDRTLANVTEDVLYLQSTYPNYTVHVVSFEHLSFREQLEHVVATDFFLAVHGAGNIHTLFLPNHATVYEYFPRSFKERKRFRFLSECLNLTYVAKKAWVVDKFGGVADPKVSVRIHPWTHMEAKYDEWEHEDGDLWGNNNH